MAKRNILLVDDEAVFLEVMGSRIRSWGYEVIPISESREALTAIKENSVDAIVLDYLMPDMDGIELLKKIRSMNTAIPVIMWTAYPKHEAMDEAKRLGIEAFIPKLSAYVDTSSNLKTTLEMIFRTRGKGETRQ